MKDKHLILIAILLLLTPTLTAQTLTLTLDDCQAMAAERNAFSKNAALDVQAAALQKRETLAEYFPRVSAMAFGYHFAKPAIEIGVKDVLGNNDFTNNLMNVIDYYGEMYGINTKYTTLEHGYGTSLLALQPIYAGGRIVNGNKLASLGIEASKLQRDIRTRKTSKEIEIIWWQLTTLEEKMLTVNSLENTLQILTNNINAAIENGLAAETDILQIKVKMNELKAAKKQLQSGIRLQKMNLMNAIGQDYALTAATATDETPLLDSIALASTHTLPSNPDDYWRDLDNIASQLDESRLLQLQIDAKVLEKKMTIGNALPQVTIVANVGYSKLISDPKVNGVAFATLQVPLSDWGKTSLKAKRIETQVEKAKNDKEYLDKQLRLRADKCWLDLTAAYDQWQVAVENETTAQTLFDVMKQNYEAGLNSIQDFLQTETTLRQAKNDVADRLVDYRLAIVEWENAIR